MPLSGALWRTMSVNGREGGLEADACPGQPDGEHAAAPGRRYLIQFVEDTLRERPIVDPRERKVHWHIRAGDGARVINHYVGDAPVTGQPSDRARRGGDGHNLRGGFSVGPAHQPGGDVRTRLQAARDSRHEVPPATCMPSASHPATLVETLCSCDRRVVRIHLGHQVSLNYLVLSAIRLIVTAIES